MKLEPMFSGGLLLRKLFNELEFSRNLSVRTKKNGDSPLLTMDIVFLSKIVENVISRCSIMSDVMGIKISAKINPELALVRIDRKLFQTILIDAILLAIRNIKNSIRDDPSKQGMCSYLFLNSIFLLLR